MRELLTVRVKGRYVVVPKLVGAFFVLVAALMLVYASLDAVSTWDRIKDLRSCVAGVYGADDFVKAYTLCVEKAQAAGVYLYTPRMEDPGSTAIPDEEFWAVLTPKLAAWLFWVVVLIISILVYQWGKLVIPVQERVQEVAEVPDKAVKAIAGSTQDDKKVVRRRRRATSRSAKKK